MPLRRALGTSYFTPFLQCPARETVSRATLARLGYIWFLQGLRISRGGLDC